MPQMLAPFRLEHTTSTGTVTTRGGVALLLEAFYATGLHEASRSIRRRPRRGYGDADHVMTVILLNLPGLASCDDVEHLRDDKALGDICGSMKAHHGSGSRMDSAFPSPPALRKWLHGQVILRIAGSIGRMLEDSHWGLLRLHHVRK
ncbi:MAG: hypothetical protein PWR28_1338 [Synergistaceae bacterium]|nr:hypothetical protein [Synergistaceae bacterium]